MSATQEGWQAVVRSTSALAFLAFVLWLFATKFDDEWKVVGTAAPFVLSREFWPMLKKVLHHTTEALSRGGKLE